MVFSLTPNATTALMDARDGLGAPDDWGIRFFAGPQGPRAVTFDFVSDPEPDDVLGGSGQLRTYVDAAVHQEIGDATVDYVDSDGSAELVIRPHRDTRTR